MVVRLSDIRPKTGKKCIFGSWVARMDLNFDDFNDHLLLDFVNYSKTNQPEPLSL